MFDSCWPFWFSTSLIVFTSSLLTCISNEMLFNTVSDYSELSRQPLNHLLAGKNNPKMLDPDTRLEFQEEFPEKHNFQEETLSKDLEKSKNTPERCMKTLEELKSRPTKNVQEDLRETSHVFQTKSIQQQQGTNIITCYLFDES